MKLKIELKGNAKYASHLVRGVWIEIIYQFGNDIIFNKSHLVRGVWIEIGVTHPSANFNALSHLVRGVWIEIHNNRLNHHKLIGRTS